MRSQARSSRGPPWTPRSCGPWPTPPGWPCWSISGTAGRPRRQSAPGSWACRPVRPATTCARSPGRGDGRERLWRITAGRYGLSGVADLAPEGREALHALLESMLAWDEARVRRYLSRLDAEPGEGQGGAVVRG